MEIQYAPDPRAMPLVTHPSRKFGPVSQQTYIDRTSPPDDPTNPAISYNNFGATTIWNVEAQAWEPQAGAAFELGVEAMDDVAMDYFEEYSVGSIASLDKGAGWNGNNGVAESCSIVSRTGPDGRTFKALSISTGQFGRKMPWGDDWNKLRLAVCWRLNGSATFTTVSTPALVGICSGTTNMGNSGTTDNFIGQHWGSAASENITYSAGTSGAGRAGYYNMGTGFRFASRRGTTTTIIAAGGSGHHIPAGAGYMGFLVIGIQRPVFETDSTSITYTKFEISTDLASVEFSRQKNCLRRLMQDTPSSGTSATPAETGIVGASVASNAAAFDQSTGQLDTVNITWPQSDETLEINGFAVRKIS